MKQHIENTRRQLGELGVMAAQNEAMDRKILERAESLLQDVQSRIGQSQGKAITESDEYMELIEERGRLQQVIAHAKGVLAR